MADESEVLVSGSEGADDPENEHSGEVEEVDYGYAE